MIKEIELPYAYSVKCNESVNAFYGISADGGAGGRRAEKRNRPTASPPRPSFSLTYLPSLTIVENSSEI